MSARRVLADELAARGARRDDDIELADTALLLAALDHPDADLNAYRAKLDGIARAVRAAADGPARRADALGGALGGELGYEGDSQTYDDPQNADLIRVIDRRKGLPVALGILYIHAARAQGWQAAGLNFPGHFLLRVECGGNRAILDPFHAGRPVAAEELRTLLKSAAGAEAELRPEHYAPVSDRDVLVRLLNNVKLRAIQMDDTARALEIVDRLLLIAPGRTGLLREAGLLHARTGDLGSAIGALSAFVERSGDPAARAEGERLLRQIRAQLN